jgi:hypothetical protein
MARGEITVTCPQCGLRTPMPIAALHRDNCHCSRCGIHIPLAGVKAEPEDQGGQSRRARPKRPYRPNRRR